MDFTPLDMSRQKANYYASAVQTTKHLWDKKPHFFDEGTLVLQTSLQRKFFQRLKIMNYQEILIRVTELKPYNITMIPLPAKYHGSAPKDEISAVPETRKKKNLTRT